MWPTEAGLSLKASRPLKAESVCMSRQLRGNEDHSELIMAWILLPVTARKRLWTQAAWCFRFRHLPFYLAHRG